MSPPRELLRTQVIPQPRDRVFAFFADAANLELLTPPFLHFRILSRLPIAMASGALIDYRIALFGVPLRWRTRIATWEPGVRFVDEQVRGPYALWHHTHQFTDVPGGTRMLDRVLYRVPFGPLGTVAHAVFVRRTLERIFDYRFEEIARRFGAPPVLDPGGSSGYQQSA